MKTDNQTYVNEVCHQVKKASSQICLLTDQVKNLFLTTLSRNLIQNQNLILEENQKDIQQAGQNQLSSALVDRLLLTPDRIKNLAESINDIIALSDPVGEITQGNIRPNGLRLMQIRVPLGVVMVIFESRPNVMIDIAALGIKSGNTVILRGGKEAYYSNQAFGKIIQMSLQENDLPEDAVKIVDRQDRSLVKLFLEKKDDIDVVVPRGGEALIKMVSELSHIPVIKHDKGLCHLYLEADAPKIRAIDLAVNGKVQRPGVCNAIETLLVHKDFPYLKEVLEALADKQVTLRLDNTLHDQYPQFDLATEEDWNSEYLDLILSVKQVENIDEAVSWIDQYGSQHTEVIVTENLSLANYFQQRVDASCVIVNASSRFNDGFMLGLGAEVGISTQKIHVRGPMGIRDLTCLKYLISGDGQVRT